MFEEWEEMVIAHDQKQRPRGLMWEDMVVKKRKEEPDDGEEDHTKEKESSPSKK